MSGVAPAARLPAALGLNPAGPGRYTATGHGDPGNRDVVYGGQLLALMILASSRPEPGSVADGKQVFSIHTVFARAARLSQPLEIEVEPLHAGRSVATDTVTVAQGDRRCVRAMVMRQTPAPDLFRHQAARPSVDPPDECPPGESAGLVAPGTEVRIIGGADLWDPDQTASPELQLWLRLPAATDPDQPEQTDEPEAVAQALLAYATNGFLIGAAMRAHRGFGLDQAHRSIDTGVLSHTVSLHEPVPRGAWLLVAHESTYAGRGRGYGRGQVFSEDGALVASFFQDSVIRQGRTL